MAFIRRFAPIPTENCTYNEEDVSLKIHALQKLTPILNDDKACFILEKEVETLNHLRQQFPNHETELCAALFDLFGKKTKNPFNAQTIKISILKGFYRHAPETKEGNLRLCQIIQSIKNPKNDIPLLQNVVSSTVDNYGKKIDPDLTLAKALKDTILFVFNAKQKPISSDRRWIHQMAELLATKHPTEEFKDFLKQFPFIKKSFHIKLTKEPANVISILRISKGRRDHHFDD